MKMIRIMVSGLILLAGVMFFSGCASPSVAPVNSPGEKIKISVRVDRGRVSEVEARQWQYRTEVAAYMERDLMSRLNRCGYDATLIPSGENSISNPEIYRLDVQIKNYNPGSSAARIMVGFGAGACSLDLRYVVKKGEKTLQEWEDGISTSGDWRRLPRALDDKLVRKLNAELLTWK